MSTYRHNVERRTRISSVCLVHPGIDALTAAHGEHSLVVRAGRLAVVGAGLLAAVRTTATTHGRCLAVFVVAIGFAHGGPVVAAIIGLAARSGSGRRRSRSSRNGGGHRLVQDTVRVQGYAEAQGAALGVGDARAAQARPSCTQALARVARRREGMMDSFMIMMSE